MNSKENYGILREKMKKTSLKAHCQGALFPFILAFIGALIAVSNDPMLRSIGLLVFFLLTLLYGTVASPFKSD